MARPREFDADKAVEDAMNVFWANGYDGASMHDLLDGMGLTRGSLYKAFTDKKTLFMTVMMRYEQRAIAPALAILNDDGTENGADRIETLFRTVADTVRSGDQRGWLLCSAAAGPASEDQEIAEVVHDLLGKMRHGFDTALRGSPAHMGLPDDDRAQLADLMISQYVGLRILSRAGAPPATLDQSVSALMALLRLSETMQ